MIRSGVIRKDVSIPGSHAGVDLQGEPIARSCWREVLGLSLCVPLGVACVIPNDPLLLAGNFPWLVLVPLLLGVQHGALAAAVSAALLGGVGLLHLQLGQQLGAPLLGAQLLGTEAALGSLGAFVAGCFAVGTIAGHFRDRSFAQVARLGQLAAKDAERLSRLARAHGVLRLSHQRLEEQVAARSWSLAGAFEDARRALGEAASPSALGDIVLNVLSNHAQVQAATLLTLVRDARGGVRLEVNATLGNVPPNPGELPRHRLVQRALESGRLVALDVESADGSDERVLAVAPLIAASGHRLGLVVIHELPFMAFQAESLNGLAAVTALLADMLEDGMAGAGSGWEHDAPFSTALASEPHALGDDDDFVGTRTGTHRRRSVARSA